MDDSTAPRLSRSRTLRVIYTFLGIICLVLAFIGIGIPVIPTFDFVLLAAFFFALGNERLHNWIVNHRWFGPIIRGWRHDRSLPLGMKVTGVVAVALSFGLTIGLAIRNIWLALGLGALGLSIMIYIWTRPTRASDAEAAPAPNNAGRQAPETSDQSA